MMARTMLVSVVLGMMTLSVSGEWKKTDMVFCTLSQEEYMKCMDLAEATARDQALDDRTFGSYYRPIRCTVPYISPEDCMKVIVSRNNKCSLKSIIFPVARTWTLRRMRLPV